MQNLNAPAVFVPLLIIFWFLREFWPFLQQTMKNGPVVPDPEPLEKADFLTAATIAVSFYLLCLWRLAEPRQTYFDEVHHVRSAMEYIWGQNPHEWSHPPLTKLIIAASMKLFGVSFDPSDGAWQDSVARPPIMPIAWRFPSVCFGSFSLLAVYALARSLFDSRKIATAATILLALDGCFFVHSRIGMTNIFTVFFVLLGTLGTWLTIKHRNRRWLFLTGLALALALSTRWSSLWAWGFNGLILLWHLFRVEMPRWQKEERNLTVELLQWAVIVGFTMLVIPLAVYATSYIPFVLQGPGDWHRKLFTDGEPSGADWSKVFQRDNFAQGHGWYKAINQQKDMWIYHSEIRDQHIYSSPWWSWPLMLRPTWYYYQSLGDGSSSAVWAIGNAVIWWGSLPALGTAAYLAIRERLPSLGIISLLGFGMWLCWGIKARPLVFMHYYFECIPFACIALAYLGWRLWQTEDARAQQFVRGVAILAGLWFFFYYPMLSAQAVPNWYFRLHLWLDKMWI